MKFESFIFEEPYDENHIKSYKKIVSLLNEIDDKIINYKFILSGGFLVFNMLESYSQILKYQDIDLFFESKEDFDKLNLYLLEVFSKKQIPYKQYKTNNANTYSFKINCKDIKLQLIQSIFDSKEKIIGSFDLENCQIALDNKGNLCMNKDFENLYWRKELKINTLVIKYLEERDTNYLFTLLNRLKKYQYRYNLINLDEATIKIIEEIEENYCQQITKDKTITCIITTSGEAKEEITKNLFEEWTSFFITYFEKYVKENNWIVTKTQL